MKPKLQWGFFLAMLFIALLARAPAGILAPVLAERSSNRLRLVDAQGSVWAGAASLSCLLPEGVAVNCGRWTWNLVPGNLGQGRLSLLVRREAANESMLVSWAPAGWELDRVEITLPAALAGSIDPKIAALRLGGGLRISSQKLSGSAGQAKISWQKMESGLLPGRTLGDCAIDVAMAPTGISFSIASVAGPVVLSGSGSVAPDGKAKLDATATVDPKNAVFPSLLSLLGKEVAPGQFRVTLP